MQCLYWVKLILKRTANTPEQKQQDLESAYFWFEKAAPFCKEAKILLAEAEKQIASHEIDDSPFSPELESCLENLHTMEREGVADLTAEAEETTIAHSWQTPDYIKENHEMPALEEKNREDVVQTLQVEESALEEPEEFFETWKLFHVPKNEKIFKNPKLLREQLKAAGLALKKKQQECRTIEIRLSPGSLEIIRILKDKNEQKNITYGLLYKLFSDPLFKAKGHIELYKSQSGIAISAKSFVTMEAFSTGTHHNHNKTYEGYNPESEKSYQGFGYIWSLIIDSWREIHLKICPWKAIDSSVLSKDDLES
jgi:exonuclease VII small subunit